MATYVLFFSAIAAGILCKKSKFITAYILVVMIILAVYKYNCADLVNYRTEYNSMVLGIGEQNRYTGHYWIVRLCSSLGFSFTQYLYVYYGLCLSLLVVAISKLTNNINIVLSSYMVYSFGIDAIQMKTMLADGFTIMAVMFLFNAKKVYVTENRSNNQHFYWFLAFAALGTITHFTNAFFVVIGIYFYFVNHEKFKKYILSFVMVVFILFLTNILPKIAVFIAQRVLPSLSKEYITFWLTRKTQWGWLIPALLLCLIMLYNKYIGKYFIINKNASEFIHYIQTFIYSIWVILPFFLYNVTFIRIVRIYGILISILISKCNGIHIKMKGTEWSVYLLFLTVIGALFMYEIGQYYNTTLGAILQYNSILE